MFKTLTKSIKSVVAISIMGIGTLAMAQPPQIWGAKFLLPYMPYSATSAQIIYLSNPSDSVADIDISAYDDKGNVYNNLYSQTTNAQTVTKLTAQISQALMDKGFTGGKIGFKFVVNNPDAIMYTSYHVGSIRGYTEAKKKYILTNPNTEETSE